MEELKRCPFCKRQAEYNEFSISPSEPLEKIVLCRNCGYSVYGPDCIERWNRRAQNIGKKECCEQEEEL